MAAPAWCGPRDRAVSAGKLTIGTGRFVLEPDKPDLFRVSPRIDSATVDLANRLVDEMNLGQGAAPDVLSVSLSATDYIGHAVGNEGVEMCIQMAELDASIGRLLAHLDARGIDYAVMLSADHGGLDTPERHDQQALPSAVRVDKALSMAELGKAIAARTGLPAQGLLFGDGSFGDFTFSKALTPPQKSQAIAAWVAIASAHPQVAAVFTADELAKAPLPSGSPQDWSLRDRARASFYAGRSGDVVVLLDRAVVPIPEAAPGY